MKRAVVCLILALVASSAWAFGDVTFDIGWGWFFKCCER